MCPKKLRYGLLILSICACHCATTNTIADTKIPDTAINRELITAVESYRKAMQELNAPAIFALAHPAYRDNAGTSEGHDDLDYHGLKQVLSTRFKQTKKINYRIQYQRIELKGTEALVDTYIDATFMYEPTGSTPRWLRLTDYNRFRLIKTNHRWQFISGL